MNTTPALLAAVQPTEAAAALMDSTGADLFDYHATRILTGIANGNHDDAARALNALCDELEAANNPADTSDTRALNAIASARAALNI